MAVVGNSVVGAGVVVIITEPQRTGGSTRSLQVGSLGWKHSEPSALVYIPKHTGMVCQSLQYEPWYWGSFKHSVRPLQRSWHEGTAANAHTDAVRTRITL